MTPRSAILGVSVASLLSALILSRTTLIVASVPGPGATVWFLGVGVAGYLILSGWLVMSASRGLLLLTVLWSVVWSFVEVASSPLFPMYDDLAMLGCAGAIVILAAVGHRRVGLGSE